MKPSIKVSQLAIKLKHTEWDLIHILGDQDIYVTVYNWPHDGARLVFSLDLAFSYTLTHYGKGGGGLSVLLLVAFLVTKEHRFYAIIIKELESNSFFGGRGACATEKS